MEIIFICWEGDHLRKKTWPFLFPELHNELRNLVFDSSALKTEYTGIVHLMSLKKQSSGRRRVKNRRQQ